MVLVQDFGSTFRQFPIRVNPLSRRVTLPTGIKLDFGGIAKGMAVDAALENLRLSGVNPAMVNAGGDLISTWLRPRIAYTWWRRLHVLTLAIYALVTIHGIGTGSDTRTWWGRSSVGGCSPQRTSASTLPLAELRLLRSVALALGRMLGWLQRV